MIKEPTNPISSAIEAKIKSVLNSGKNCSRDCVPCPNPLPKISPDPTAIVDCITLYPLPKGSDSGAKKLNTLCL